MQFEITPKALANFSPGLERSENPGIRIRKRTLNPGEDENLPAYYQSEKNFLRDASLIFYDVDQ